MEKLHNILTDGRMIQETPFYGHVRVSDGVG